MLNKIWGVGEGAYRLRESQQSVTGTGRAGAGTNPLATDSTFRTKLTTCFFHSFMPYGTVLILGRGSVQSGVGCRLIASDSFLFCLCRAENQSQQKKSRYGYPGYLGHEVPVYSESY